MTLKLLVVFFFVLRQSWLFLHEDLTVIIGTCLFQARGLMAVKIKREKLLSDSHSFCHSQGSQLSKRQAETCRKLLFLWLCSALGCDYRFCKALRIGGLLLLLFCCALGSESYTLGKMLCKFVTRQFFVEQVLELSHVSASSLPYLYISLLLGCEHLWLSLGNPFPTSDILLTRGSLGL